MRQHILSALGNSASFLSVEEQESAQWQKRWLATERGREKPADQCLCLQCMVHWRHGCHSVQVTQQVCRAAGGSTAAHPWATRAGQGRSTHGRAARPDISPPWTASQSLPPCSARCTCRDQTKQASPRQEAYIQCGSSSLTPARTRIWVSSQGTWISAMASADCWPSSHKCILKSGIRNTHDHELLLAQLLVGGSLVGGGATGGQPRRLAPASGKIVGTQHRFHNFGPGTSNVSAAALASHISATQQQAATP